MDLAMIDLFAHKGDSVLHRSSAISKFLFVLFLIGAVVIAKRPTELLVVMGVVLSGYVLAHISLVRVGHYALYPAFFSLIFAIFRFTVSFSAGLTVILKAVTAALALLLLIFTTPYTQIFTILRKILPGVLVDGLFFTYRIFFILIKEMENLLVNIRLKGGYHPRRLFFNLKNLAGSLGVLFIHAFDLSERIHQMMLIRGYRGTLHTEMTFHFNWQDFLLLIAGICVLFLVVIL